MTIVLIRALSPLSAAGLERMLSTEPDITVVREGSGESSGEPDVILTEVGEAAESAWEALPELSGGGPAVVLLADDAHPLWTWDALASGVKAVLPRRIRQEELVAAVRAAGAGLLVIHPEDLDSFLPARAGGGTSGFPQEGLTPRERDVLRTMAEGLSNKEIASRLGISDHTVKFHVAAILGKLGAMSRTEAVMIAVRRGLVMV
jgi:two-component system, NarL family, response regulator YdfI